MKTHLIYAGLRKFDTDSVSHAFFAPGKPDELLFFDKVKWCRIGYKYAATKKKNGFQMKVNPEEIGPPESDTEKLEIEDQAARAFKKRKAEANKAKKFPWENKTVGEIKEMLSRQGISWEVRRRIGDRISMYLTDGDEK